MYRESRTNGINYFTPRRNLNTKPVAEKAFISEWKWGVLGLVFSLSVILAKILISHGDYLYDVVVEKRLVSYETIVTDGDIFVEHVWTNVLKYSNIWFPLLCGFVVTHFTWSIVYLDSSVPGVEPPSPFSPSKIKMRSGHTFHLNYVFAILIGLFVFVYMYIKQVKLQF